MQKTIVVGNSHSMALQTAPKRDGIDVYRLMRNKNGRLIGDIWFDEILDIIRQKSGRIVVSVLGGNQHQLYLVERPEPFDFIEPGAAAVSAGHKIIPYTEMYELFWANNERKQLKALRRAAAGAVYHLAVPPPKEDEAHIRRHHESVFHDDILAGKPLTKASVRAKLWRLQDKVTQEICRRLNVEYVPVPAGTKDENDFLLPKYYANDATHANAAYGALVLDQIAALQRSALKTQKTPADPAAAEPTGDL